MSLIKTSIEAFVPDLKKHPRLAYYRELKKKTFLRNATRFEDLEEINRFILPKN